MTGAPDFKRGRRYVASSVEWTALHDELKPPGTLCFCGCGRLAESLGHLVARSLEGDDVRDNLVPLAGDGTRLCHGALDTDQPTHDIETGEMIQPERVRAGIAEHLTAAHRAYVESVKPGFLDRYYALTEPEQLSNDAALTGALGGAADASRGGDGTPDPSGSVSACETCGRPLTPDKPKRAKREKPRNRAAITVNVPKDERENGAEVLEELIQAHRERLAPQLGWDANVPAYFVLTAVLAEALQGERRAA